MILVTGTKRSGTSLWMQILIQAGLPYIGKDYMGTWEDSIREANPQGFWESSLRRGVYFATNPDPETGKFLHPKQTRRHVLKVFIPGLNRTDYAYLDRVVGTIRPWREYCASLQRLYTMEDEFLATSPPDTGPNGERISRLKRAQESRSKLPMAIEWWYENYDLIRDIATRRYPVNLVSYHRLLESPETLIPNVLEWLGGGHVDAAIAVVDPALRTQNDPTVEQPVEPEWAAIFDALHDELYTNQTLPRTLLEEMNTLDQSIGKRFPRPPGLR